MSVRIGSEIWSLRAQYGRETLRDRIGSGWIVGETSRSWLVGYCRDKPAENQRCNKIPKAGEGPTRATKSNACGRAIVYWLDRAAFDTMIADVEWRDANGLRIRSAVERADVATLRRVDAALAAAKDGAK